MPKQRYAPPPEHKPTNLTHIQRGRVWGPWVVDCKCGWGSPLCVSRERAQYLWREHAGRL